jgi:hypothetical protein
MNASITSRIRVVTVISLIVLLGSLVAAADEPYGNLKLLDGFKYKRSNTFDTINGLIYSSSGFSIEFESGTGLGFAADPKKRTQYAVFREHTVNGNKIYLAITLPGVGTNWEPKNKRSRESGRIVLITFPGNMSPLHAANFSAEVKSDSELADMLLMVLTFDPKR